MTYIIKDIGKGTYGDAGTPLSENNLLPVVKGNILINNIKEIPNRSYLDLQDVPSLDNYQNWKISINGGTADNIDSNEILDLIEGSGMTISKTGNQITFSSTGGGASVKPGKEINATSYTLQLEDRNKWLRFTQPGTVVTVPNALYSADDVIEGEAESGADVTFQDDGTFVLRKPSAFITSIPGNGVFGIKIKDTGDGVIFGTLDLA